MEGSDIENNIENNIETEVKKVRKPRKKKADATPVDAATPVDVAVAPEAEPSATPTVRKKKYINNADLMIQIALSRKQDKMTDELAKMLFMLCKRYAKHPDYANVYSYNEDMEAFALLTVCKVWRGFNPEKGNNPFAYFTQIIRHAFYQYLNHEKRQREVKDNILVDIGELPSFTYMENYREERDNDYEGSLNETDEDDNTRQPRPGFTDTLPGVVTEINYDFDTRSDDVPITNDEGISEV